MKLALFGGSFNPVHNGHVALALSVMDILSYDRIILIPALMSPLKRMGDYIDPEHRMEMLRLAFAGREWAEISPCEINRTGPSYTADTIEEVYGKYDFDGKPGLIVGDDWADGFVQWRNVDAIVAKTDLVVARREGGGEDFPFPCTYLRNPIVTVSSTEIRRMRQEGNAVSDYVPPAVAAYMEKHRLYAD